MAEHGADRSPTLYLYGKPGCHLCEETEARVSALLARRGAPATALVVRDITSDPDWERAFFTTIPVLEAGDRRYELATSPARIAVFVDEALG